MSGAVLDSSALLAVINAEPGEDRVTEFLDGALLSAVNYAEVVTKLVERGVDRDVARATVSKIGVQIVEFGPHLAERTGELRTATRHLGLSLGDRACFALAENEGLPAVTADKKWAAANIGVEVILIR